MATHTLTAESVPPTASHHLFMAETHGRPRDSPRPVFFESGRPLCRRWPSPQPGPGHLYVSDTPLRCGPSQAAVIVKCNQESESLDGRLPGEQNTVAGWLEMAVEFDVGNVMAFGLSNRVSGALPSRTARLNRRSPQRSVSSPGRPPPRLVSHGAVSPHSRRDDATPTTPTTQHRSCLAGPIQIGPG